MQTKLYLYFIYISVRKNEKHLLNFLFFANCTSELWFQQFFFFSIIFFLALSSYASMMMHGQKFFIFFFIICQIDDENIGNVLNAFFDSWIEKRRKSCFGPLTLPSNWKLDLFFFSTNRKQDNNKSFYYS